MFFSFCELYSFSFRSNASRKIKYFYNFFSLQNKIKKLNLKKKTMQAETILEELFYEPVNVKILVFVPL